MYAAYDNPLASPSSSSRATEGDMGLASALTPAPLPSWRSGNALIHALHAYNMHVQTKEPQCCHRHVCILCLRLSLRETDVLHRLPPLVLTLLRTLFPPDYPRCAAYRGAYTILALPRWPSKLWSLSNYLTSFQTSPRLSTAATRGTFEPLFCRK